MTLGIRENRIGHGLSRDERRTRALMLGLTVSEVVVDRVSLLDPRAPSVAVSCSVPSSLPVISVCLDHLMSRTLGDQILTPFQTLVQALVADADRVVTALSTPEIAKPFVLLPCLGCASLQVEATQEAALTLFNSMVCQNPLVVEVDLSLRETTALLDRCPSVSLCLDLGNLRTYEQEDMGWCALAPRIALCHLKHRSWGSAITRHLPEGPSALVWYQTRLSALRDHGFDGPVILETPEPVLADDLSRNVERAHLILRSAA